MKLKEYPTEVKSYRINLQCPKCTLGSLISTNNYLASHPPQYIHECDECGYTKGILGGKKYPYIDYKEII